MSTPPTPPPPPHGVTLHIPRRSVIFVLILLLSPWLIFGAYYASGILTNHTPDKSTPTLPLIKGATLCAPGPWGNLEYVRILTEPPEQQISGNIPFVDHATWVFKNYTPAAFDELWQSAGLTSAELGTINRPELRTTEGDTVTIRAPKDFVLNLTPAARNVIYTALSAFAENPAQVEPYRFTVSARDEWFKESGLKPETIAQVERLLYQRGNSLLFSDQALLLPALNSLEESTRLLKTLARKSTLLLKLRIDPGTDTEALERYWSFPGSKDIGPLLNSLKRLGSSTTLDIVHLLPRFARSRLYSYPSPSDPGSTTYMDCHWTVLNFFNQEPDPRYEDINQVALAFRTNYHPVTGRPRYGDIYLFTEPDGDVIHSCVYIADNIVFTKNGASLNAPWILMKYEDIVAFYPSNQPLDIQRYRPNVMSSN